MSVAPAPLASTATLPVPSVMAPVSVVVVVEPVLSTMEMPPAAPVMLLARMPPATFTRRSRLLPAPPPSVMTFVTMFCPAVAAAVVVPT